MTYLFEKIIDFSIKQRWLIILLTIVLISLGLYNLQKLPIDAVPDITNVQVQINTEAPGYSPLETKLIITYRVDTSIDGIQEMDYTRYLSCYVLSQVTVVFEEVTDIFFARRLINER